MYAESKETNIGSYRKIHKGEVYLMATLADIKSNTVFALFKGEPGTRKSTAALSFPTPQYWIPTDDKMNALILPAKNFGINFADINYDKFQDWNSILKKLNELQVKCPYKTVIIDSITSLGDVINRQTIKFKTGTTTKAGDEKGMRVGGIPVNTIEDYKAEASAFQELISTLKDIKNFHNVNIILIAHVVGERKIDDVGITHHARTIITGGKTISGKISAYCDETYHFNVEREIDISKPGKYTLFTTHVGDDFARTALPLPTKIEFNDKSLYKEWIEPALKKLKGE